MNLILFTLAIWQLLPWQLHSYLMYNDNMRSFSHAQKEGRCAFNKEVILFERHGQPAVITEQWFTGSGCFEGNSIIR